MLVIVESQFSSKQLLITVLPMERLMYHLEKTALAVSGGFGGGSAIYTVSAGTVFTG